MAAVEIIPGVHAIDKLGIGRAYLYQEADRLTLIDTGLPSSAKRIFSAIDRVGRRPEDLRQIVITHYHADHTGALAEVVERTNAQVLVHKLDAPVVRGERPPAGPNLPGPLAAVVTRFDRGVRPAAPSRVDQELADGDEIELDGGARIVHTPGHTPGNIAVYLPARRLLFAGDAAANAMGVRPPVGMFTEDGAAARESIKKLARLDFEVACFGHGPPLDKEASLAFRRLAEKLA